jgi:hypothetical protein
VNFILFFENFNTFKNNVISFKAAKVLWFLKLCFKSNALQSNVKHMMHYFMTHLMSDKVAVLESCEEHIYQHLKKNNNVKLAKVAG